jgi:hypothetical protein
MNDFRPQELTDGFFPFFVPAISPTGTTTGASDEVDWLDQQDSTVGPIVHAARATAFAHYADEGGMCTDADKDHEPPPAPAPPAPACDPDGDASVCPSPLPPMPESESMDWDFIGELLDLGHLGHELFEMVFHGIPVGPFPPVFPKMPSRHPNDA